MTKLLLGPMLRFISATEATVWVQTDGGCDVEILGRRAHTFHWAGRHYALVAISGLAPASSTQYQVRLDGQLRWPEPNSPYPPSRIQTLPQHGPITIAWGSCRIAAPHTAPYTLDAEQDERGLGVDALYALALRLRDSDPATWPRMLLAIGDQVYADEVSPRTLDCIRQKRDTSIPPGEQVLDVDEYAALYHESWSEPSLRWLLSTIPSAMMFDDHDVHDDWNTSASWIEDMRATSWWRERILAALSTYWVYQHLGNLSPHELAEDPLYAAVQEADDAAALLRRFAADADRKSGGSLWSFSRLLGATRLVVLDGREGRLLVNGRREMIDEAEWRWFEGELTGDFDHVLIASTLPILLAPTLHHVEAWNEAICQGAWGRWLQGPAERLRRGLDLEHWAAFQGSFSRMIELITEVGSGRRGVAPASIVMLGGDVHQAYLERVGFRAQRGVTSAVYQAVCSPFRNQLGRRERTMLGIGRRSKLLEWLARRAAHATGVSDPDIRWRVVQQPTWRNQLGWLAIDGRRLALTIETTPASHAPALEVSLRHQLA